MCDHVTHVQGGLTRNGSIIGHGLAENRSIRVLRAAQPVVFVLEVSGDPPQCNRNYLGGH